MTLDKSRRSQLAKSEKEERGWNTKIRLAIQTNKWRSQEPRQAHFLLEIAMRTPLTIHDAILSGSPPRVQEQAIRGAYANINDLIASSVRPN